MCVKRVLPRATAMHHLTFIRRPLSLYFYPVLCVCLSDSPAQFYLLCLSPAVFLPARLRGEEDKASAGERRMCKVEALLSTRRWGRRRRGAGEEPGCGSWELRNRSSGGTTLRDDLGSFSFRVTRILPGKMYDWTVVGLRGSSVDTCH